MGSIDWHWLTHGLLFGFGLVSGVALGVLVFEWACQRFGKPFA